MRRHGWGVPIILGLVTLVLVGLVLWPNEPKPVPVVVAAYDLGAGAELIPADLTVTNMPPANAPADAVSDPNQLVGQTLAVVRFAGEPVTPRHLGPPVSLQPNERGVAVRVEADTGLAGLLRPGMNVGVIATIADRRGDAYAKALIEGLRVLYVPPDFQAQPYRPIQASMTVNNQSGGDATAVSAPSPSPRAVSEGVVVLAASTEPTPIYYAPITDTVPLTHTLGAAVVDENDLRDFSVWTGPEGGPDMVNAKVVWSTPVELLALLNAADNALTLTLTPAENPAPYVTSGVTLSEIIITPTPEEKEVKR